MGVEPTRLSRDLKHFECCMLCLSSQNLMESSGISWSHLFSFSRGIPAPFSPNREVQRNYLNPTQFFPLCSKYTLLLPQGKNQERTLPPNSCTYHWQFHRVFLWNIISYLPICRKRERRKSRGLCRQFFWDARPFYVGEVFLRCLPRILICGISTHP